MEYRYPSPRKDDSSEAKLPAKIKSDLRYSLHKCRVCGKELSLQSPRQATNVFKITKCCKVFGCLHIKCARKVSTGLDGSYKFDALTYGDDNSTSLYCFVCNTKCFFCGKNHRLPLDNKDQDTSVGSCIQCNKWCYMTKKCNVASVALQCHECKSKIDNNEVISDQPPIQYPISPITTECNSSQQVRIHQAISKLLTGVRLDTDMELIDYKRLLTKTITHLHPSTFNIFSLNHATTEPVNGLFLSAESVMSLVLPESKFMVTEEVMNLFVDCFNFYGEVVPEGNKVLPDEEIVTTNQPDIIFCKPNDDVAKINVLYNKKNNFKLIVNAIPTYLTDDDENDFKNEIKVWYGSNYNTFLDSVITKYHANSTHVNQICVPIKGNQWSIIDVKVNPFDIIKVKGKPGFVQQIIFKDLPTNETSINLDAIENKTFFSTVWWAKYFGLYSCQNRVNEVSKPMYFGTNDIIFDQDLEGAKESSALERFDPILCKQNGLFARNGDFSIQALLVMIQRLKNTTLDTENQVIECHNPTRLLVIEFILNIVDIINIEDYEWHYDYQEKGLARDDAYWRTLFASSKNDDFDMSNVWTLYTQKQNEDHHGKQKHKFVQKKVVFSNIIGNPWKGDIDLSKIKHVQNLKTSGRGMVVPVVRHPIVLNGVHWDIVDKLHTFFIESVADNKEGKRADHLKEHHGLYHHVLECMRNHTTYFLLSNISVKDAETNVEGKEDSIVAAMIVEKNVIMTEQEKTRALIHYICVDPQLRRNDFATALMKSVFCQKEYHERDIMAVTALPQDFLGYNSDKSMVNFFDIFGFVKMVSKNKKAGENDVDKIVLKGASVHMLNQKLILSMRCNLVDWKSDNGYYEIDNFTKYSIAYNPIDECLYAKGAHFGWSKVDENDYIDYPVKRIELARHWPGHEIRLTAGGRRNEEASVKASLVDQDAIPVQFRQSSYEYEHGCVWLSACLLMNTVDSDVATLMIESYEADEGKYEWMDIFNRKKKSRKNLRTFSPFNLHQQLRLIKGNQYDLCKVQVFKDNTSADVTQLILNEKNIGLFVAIISSKDGNCTHAVGIDTGSKTIYDCIEDNVLQLNEENMSLCCGPNQVFNKIEYVGELKKKRQKKRKM